MKNKVVFFVLGLLLLHGVALCQMQQAGATHVTAYAKKSIQRCTVHKIGIGVSLTGAVLIPAGLFLDNVSPGPYGGPTFGVYAAVAGVMILVAGGGLIIGGTIYDHHHRHSISFISPRRNEAGLAYNL